MSSRSWAARQTPCDIESMCQVPGTKHEILNLVTDYLEELGCTGEAGAEYLAMYKRLISSGHWKYYLALRGVLSRVASLSALEEMTLSSDLSQGYALKALTELLMVMVLRMIV